MAAYVEQVPVGEFHLGDDLFALCSNLFPICRSLTGAGVRETLTVIDKVLPLTVHEVPSGTEVLGWTVPDEWNIVDAYVKNSRGERVIDFQRSNLHVVGYSTPVHEVMSLAELRQHVHTIPEHPGWIPYRTSFYRPSWGFCTSHDDLARLEEDEYEVMIDSTLAPGSLTYAEAYLPGAVEEEVLISTHVCHPSLANDNVSGMALTAYLGAHLSARDRHYSYRLLFIPSTLGSITWLARNEEAVSRIRHGVVVTGVGDRGPVVYKRSRRGDAGIDRAAAHVLARRGSTDRVVDFYPYGYDERQFCSPGFDMPVGRLSRTPHNQYPEYHTSADDLSVLDPECLLDSFDVLTQMLDVVDANHRFVNQHPMGEPKLDSYGLYSVVAGEIPDFELALLWVLNWSDGRHDLLDVAEQAGLDFPLVRRAADALVRHGLLVPVDPQPGRHLEVVGDEAVPTRSPKRRPGRAVKPKVARKPSSERR
jgi:aminopeptidase-like protein